LDRSDEINNGDIIVSKSVAVRIVQTVETEAVDLLSPACVASFAGADPWILDHLSGAMRLRPLGRLLRRDDEVSSRSGI
jgi:hypothetical protein